MQLKPESNPDILHGSQVLYHKAMLVFQTASEKDPTQASCHSNANFNYTVGQPLLYQQSKHYICAPMTPYTIVKRCASMPRTATYGTRIIAPYCGFVAMKLASLLYCDADVTLDHEYTPVYSMCLKTAICTELLILHKDGDPPHNAWLKAKNLA